jgi:acetyl-CoA synthetase
VYVTESMPKTRTGKTMRRLLRDLLVHGKPLGDTSAVEDVSALNVVAEAVRE